MAEFTHLMSPITIRGKTYRNRILAAPTGFAAFLKTPFAKGTLSMLYDRAVGGQASVCLGEAMVCYPHGLSDDKGQIPIGPMDASGPDSPDYLLLKEAAEIIKREGALAFGELNHPGASGTPFGEFSHPLGPVAYMREDGVEVRAFTQEDMNVVKAEFARHAAFLKEAGYDGVLIHGGHGFLFTQFLSPRENTRTDEYGGTAENRARFPLEILKAVRQAVGEDFLIELRVSGTERLKGGVTPELTGDFCSRLKGLVDIVHVSSGHYYRSLRTKEFSSMYDPHGCNVKAAQIIRRSLPDGVYLGVVGGINSPEFGEKLIKDGAVDFIILGRQMFADSDFAKKVAEGNSKDIQRCIRCMRCYSGSVEHPIEIAYNKKHGSRDQRPGLDDPFCNINPRTRLFVAPSLSVPTPVQEPQKVLVIGGGPAGLSAARYLSDAGHRVTLVEKTGRLGGVLWFADSDGDKEDLRNFRDLLVRRVLTRPIEVYTNAEVTAENIGWFKCQTVVVAIGAEPAVPPIPGISYAIHALQTYAKDFSPKQNIVIVGGGLVGCDTAVNLARKGRTVTIIEQMDRVAAEVSCMAFTAIMDQLEQLGVRCITEARCTEILPDGVRYEQANGVTEFAAADTVVYSLGMRPKSDMMEQWKRKLSEEVEVYSIGDCTHAARVGEAVKAGLLVAKKISGQ